MQGTKNSLVRLIELVALLALGLVSPYFSILVIWYLGFLVLDWLPPLWRLALGPAVGMGIVIFVVHITSIVGFSIWLTVPVVYLITLLLWWKDSKGSSLSSMWNEIPLIDRLFLSISVFLSAGLKIPFLSIPSYSSAPKDPVFHAYKTWEILKEGTIFIKHAPISFSGILTYPAGYHSLVAWISLVSGVKVPFSMMSLQLFTWIFLPLGTYLASWSMFQDKWVSRISAAVMPLTYLYYYYLHYSLLHLFLDYYLLLASIAVYTQLITEITKDSVKQYHVSWFVILFLLTSSLLIVHPYPYLLFQAYALFLAVLIIPGITTSQKMRTLFLFFFQAAGSFLVYYFIEAPNRLNVERYSKPLFHISKYYLKDNPHWFYFILKQTFWANGQFVFLPFFIVSTFWILHRKNKQGLALISTLLFFIFLIFDKIWFHVNVPYYSAIWNSERIYILLTPLFPLLHGLGISLVKRHIEARRKVILAITLTALFVIPGTYVNIDNYARELCVTVDNNTLLAFRYVDSLTGPIYVQNSLMDSGIWIPIFTDKEIIRVTTPPKKGILYVDSRGYGDIHAPPLNPLQLVNKSALISYYNGIWIFNLSQTWRDSREDALNDLYRHLMLRRNSIKAYNFEDWRYFVYGFLLRHPVVVRGILLKQWSGVFSIVNDSYIVFIPDQNYSSLRIIGLGEPARVYLNGVYLGVLDRGSVSFMTTLEKGKFYVLKFEGKVYIERIILRG
ncbi:hypothetical protein [Thermococcus sp. AM4]|uniref:hypothetical protein n=1 Tax=Thermococcus sp. (strain AM4) TaxID=246969 RepID=UPI000229941E|nr:hypothetical protein [Thermococcus sp. AM4]AEO13949.1 hypothetical protein TAM4_2351 [Thermococcus sp. AM4]